VKPIRYTDGRVRIDKKQAHLIDPLW